MNKDTFKGLKIGDKVTNRLNHESAIVTFAERDWQIDGTRMVELSDGRNIKIDDNLTYLEK